MMGTAQSPTPDMDITLLSSYMNMIRAGVEGVARAGRLIDRAAAQVERRVEDPHYEESSELCWDGVMLLVSNAAALSRIFSPQKVRRTKGEALERYGERVHQRTQRGVQLQAWFNLTDDSPLATRDFRNSIEHWDEYLEERYTDHHSKQGHIDLWVGSPSPADHERHYIARLYDYRRRTATVGGRLALPIDPLVNEAAQIGKVHDRLWDSTPALHMQGLVHD